MPVTLESRARRMQVFHLPHDVFCRDRCACTEVAVVVVAENPRTGERAPKRLHKKVPGSLTFLALERKPGLPSALLEVADVKAAIGRGYLRIVEQTPDQAPSVAAEHESSISPAPAASAPPQPPAPTAPPPAQAPAPTASVRPQAPAPATAAAYTPTPAASAPPQPPGPVAPPPSPASAAKPPGKES
jgi:hypothetical protein